MPEYKAPVRDIKFVMQELLDCDSHYQELGYEVVSIPFMSVEKRVDFIESKIS